MINHISKRYTKGNITIITYIRDEKINNIDMPVKYAVVYNGDILINNIIDAKRTISDNVYKKWIKNFKKMGLIENEK